MTARTFAGTVETNVLVPHENVSREPSEASWPTPPSFSPVELAQDIRKSSGSLSKEHGKESISLHQHGLLESFVSTSQRPFSATFQEKLETIVAKSPGSTLNRRNAPRRLLVVVVEDDHQSHLLLSQCELHSSFPPLQDVTEKSPDVDVCPLPTHLANYPKASKNPASDSDSQPSLPNRLNR